MDTNTISKGTIPTLNTRSRAPEKVNSGAEDPSAAAPANSLVINNTIKATVAISPNPAMSEVAVVALLAMAAVVVVVVVVTVVTVEIKPYLPFPIRQSFSPRDIT